MKYGGKYSFEVSFRTEDDRGMSLTGKGEAIKIINTVLDVVETFHENYSEYVKHYTFKPEKRSGEESDIPIRTRVFKKFIKRRFPRAEVNVYGGHSAVIKP